MSNVPTPEQSTNLKSNARNLILGLAAIVVAIAGYRYWSLHNERNKLEEEVAAGPHVQIVKPAHSPADRTLNLVGEARPYASVTLYAKVSGYLRSVKVDKGDKVKQNQILAIIESPEIDKDYQGALADSRNKSSIAGRMNQLKERNLVSPQEVDQANSDSEIARSKLEALEVQKGYETIRAPFPGTVVARYADAGALMQNAANAQTSALPVVTVAQVDRLRVYIYVDQRDAAYIKVDSMAEVKLAERPELKLQAKITRVSGELDPKTKMLLTEIDVDNANNQMVPGSFVQVSVNVHSPESFQLPVQALVMQQGKSLVPIVDAEDRIHLKEVQIGENDGEHIFILSGVSETDRVALNIGNNIPDGSHVRPNESGGPKPASK